MANEGNSENIIVHIQDAAREEVTSVSNHLALMKQLMLAIKLAVFATRPDAKDKLAVFVLDDHFAEIHCIDRKLDAKFLIEDAKRIVDCVNAMMDIYREVEP